MTWRNRKAWLVSIASTLYYYIIITMVTLYYRWLVKSCTIGKLLPTNTGLFTSNHDSSANDKPDFDIKVFQLC